MNFPFSTIPLLGFDIFARVIICRILFFSEIDDIHVLLKGVGLNGEGCSLSNGAAIGSITFGFADGTILCPSFKEICPNGDVLGAGEACGLETGTNVLQSALFEKLTRCFSTKDCNVSLVPNVSTALSLVRSELRALVS